MSYLKAAAGKMARKIEWHAAQKPIVINKRLVFERPLNGKIQLLDCQVPVQFRALSAEDQVSCVSKEYIDDIIDLIKHKNILVKGFVHEKDVCQLEVTCREEEIVALIPPFCSANRAAFIYNCYTHPDYRGYNLYPAALSWLLSCIRVQGFKRAFLRTHPRNTSSIKGAVKAGFNLRGAIYHCSFFGFNPRPVTVKRRN